MVVCATVVCATVVCATVVCATVVCATVVCATVVCATVVCATVALMVSFVMFLCPLQNAVTLVDVLVRHVRRCDLKPHLFKRLLYQVAHVRATAS